MTTADFIAIVTGTVCGWLVIAAGVLAVGATLAAGRASKSERR